MILAGDWMKGEGDKRRKYLDKHRGALQSFAHSNAMHKKLLQSNDRDRPDKRTKSSGHALNVINDTHLEAMRTSCNKTGTNASLQIKVSLFT